MVVSDKLGALEGCYLQKTREIFINAKLHPLQQRWVLAHELGHHFTGDSKLAYYSHRAGGCRSTLSEAKAEQWAWDLLVDKNELKQCIEESLDADLIAFRLRIPVEAVIRWWERKKQQVATHQQRPD